MVYKTIIHLSGLSNLLGALCLLQIVNTTTYNPGYGILLVYNSPDTLRFAAYLSILLGIIRITYKYHNVHHLVACTFFLESWIWIVDSYLHSKYTFESIVIIAIFVIQGCICLR